VNPRARVSDTLTAQETTELQAGPNESVAAAILGKATTRIVYDVRRFARDAAAPRPSYAATIARETHFSDPAGPASKIQLSFSYWDGFGREIKKKIQAEPGALVKDGATVDPRWVGSGWTVFNNKKKPVRKYEPFLSPTHNFEFGVKAGV